MTKKFNKTLICAYCILMISAMNTTSTGLLLPYIREAKGIDYAFYGIVVSMHSVGSLFSSFMAGVMPRFVGRKRSMLLFNTCIFFSFLLILVGASKYIIAFAFFLTGVARGASSNFLNGEVMSAAPGSAMALNTLHASYAVGALLFPIILMGLVNNNPNRWTLACIFMIIMGIISLIIYYVMPIATEEKKIEKKKTDYGFFKDKLFYIILFGLFFYLCCEQAVIGWLVTYLKDTGYLKDPLASLTTTIQWSCVLIGRLSAAFLSEKIGKNKILPIMGIGQIIFFVMLIFSKTPVPIIIAIAGFGLSMAGVYPTIASYGGEIMKKYPMCWSYVLTGAGFGSIIMPAVIGFLADSFGIYIGMCSIVFVVVVEMFIIIKLINYTKKMSKTFN